VQRCRPKFEGEKDDEHEGNAQYNNESSTSDSGDTRGKAGTSRDEMSLGIKDGGNKLESGETGDVSGDETGDKIGIETWWTGGDDDDDKTGGDNGGDDGETEAEAEAATSKLFEDKTGTGNDINFFLLFQAIERRLSLFLHKGDFFFFFVVTELGEETRSTWVDGLTSVEEPDEAVEEEETAEVEIGTGLVLSKSLTIQQISR